MKSESVIQIKSFEFALKKATTKDYKIVNLTEDFTDIAGDTKRAAKEINNRLALHVELEGLRTSLSVFIERIKF